MSVRRHPLSLLGAATLLSLTGVGTACNPLVFGELVDQAPVQPFALNAPISGNPYGRETLRLPGGGSNDGSVLMLGDGIPIVSSMTMTPGYDVIGSHPTGTQLNDLFRPLMDLDTSNFGGIDLIPAQDGSGTRTAVIGVTSTFDATTARVFQVNLDEWSRVTDPEIDIIAPWINNSTVIGFGQDVQATNLDAAQSDPAYEVAIGSASGVIIFDDLGANTETYLEERAAILAVDGSTFDGDNLAQGFHFTLCDELSTYNHIARGAVGPSGSEVFLVSTTAGITMIGDQDVTNQIGAPVYDCAADFIANPGGSTEGFGHDMFVDDLNDDGMMDLFVSDTSTNEVYLYLGVADGLPDDPSQTFTPPESQGGVHEYGFSVDRADLGGGFGSAIVITAPGSSTDGLSEVGVIFVYRVNDNGVIEENAEPIILEDLSPEGFTRYGIWAGGIYNGELGRDELMVVGSFDGRIHTSISGIDPS
jgi:hypothetical protein